MNVQIICSGCILPCLEEMNSQMKAQILLMIHKEISTPAYKSKVNQVILSSERFAYVHVLYALICRVCVDQSLSRISHSPLWPGVDDFTLTSFYTQFRFFYFPSTCQGKQFCFRISVMIIYEPASPTQK